MAANKFQVSYRDCEHLSALLPDFVARSSETIPDWVFDGFPCRLAAVQRQPRVTVRSECNTAGVSEEFAVHPTPRMMRAILELADRVTMQSANSEVVRMSP